MLARNVRRYDRKRCSKTRPIPAIDDGDVTGGVAVPALMTCRRSSVDEGASGQPEEDVLERRAADEDGFGLEAPRMSCRHGRLAIVGVEQDAIGQALDPLGQTVELTIERLLDAGREPELGDL